MFKNKTFYQKKYFDYNKYNYILSNNNKNYLIIYKI